MEKLQVHKRIRQIVTEHACHAGSLEKNDTVDYSLQIGKNGMLRVKMLETMDISRSDFTGSKSSSGFSEGHTSRVGKAETLPFQNMKYLIQMEIDAGKLSAGIKGFMLHQMADATQQGTQSYAGG